MADDILSWGSDVRQCRRHIQDCAASWGAALLSATYTVLIRSESGYVCVGYLSLVPDVDFNSWIRDVLSFAGAWIPGFVGLPSFYWIDEALLRSVCSCEWMDGCWRYRRCDGRFQSSSYVV